MKTKFTLLVLVFGLCCFMQVNGQQQILNGTFENWTNNDPNNWSDVDQVIYSVSGGTATDTLVSPDSTRVHGGRYSAKLSSDVVPYFSHGVLPGIVSVGPLSYASQMVNYGGVAYTDEPDSLSFWYIYSPAGGDIATLTYSLTEWTGTKEEVVGGSARGELRQLAASAQYQQVVLKGHDKGFPASDSLFLAFYSGTYPYTAGSNLWLDDVAFIFNGQSTDVQNLTLHTEVALFPVPASTTLNIKVSDAMVHNSYTIIDILGNIVGKGIIESATNQLDVSSFASGHYFYTITDNDKKVAAQGRFAVTH